MLLDDKFEDNAKKVISAIQQQKSMEKALLQQTPKINNFVTFIRHHNLNAQQLPRNCTPINIAYDIWNITQGAHNDPTQIGRNIKRLYYYDASKNGAK